MNPQDPLAALHPLREPELVSWWPPAPGWWVLGALLLLGLAILTWFALRRYQRNAYRRQALARLEALQSEYRSAGDLGSYAAGINALLTERGYAACLVPRIFHGDRGEGSQGECHCR